MRLKGRTLNAGTAAGKAMVFHTPFSFIGDMDPRTGAVTMVGNPLFGESLAGRVLVMETGRGGTIAPYMLYEAHKNGVAPVAILCDHADMLTLECALTIDIPVLDSFAGGITNAVESGDGVTISRDGTLEIEKA